MTTTPLGTPSGPGTDAPGLPAQRTPATTTVDDVAERVFAATLAAMDVAAIHLGDRLGWYRSLAADGPATPSELAARTGTAERYAREWLQQQATTGLLRAEADGGAERRYALGPAEAEVLTDTASLSYLAPLARMVVGAVTAMPALLEAYRTGGGVSWQQLGDDVRESQADANRPWFEKALVPALAGVPDLQAALSRPGARVADVGCGHGWSTLALARAYPQAEVVGVDADAPSVAAARDALAAAGLGERVTVVEDRAEGLATRGPLDVVFFFECLHDMARPVEALAAARAALAPGGRVVVMDEAVAEDLTPGDDVERLMHGFSLLVCLPDGLSSTPSAGTGTVMRPSTLRRYAREAGFSSTEVLPVEDFGFWRFYGLTP